MGLILVVLTVGACGPDLSAVPTIAKESFVCDGVPEAGAKLILGGPVVAQRTVGSWEDSNIGFRCGLAPESKGRGVILVSDVDVRNVAPGGTEDGQLRELASQGDPKPIKADADGAGYVYGSNPSPIAGWVCHGRYLAVELTGIGVDKRNQRADAEAYLVSMLPWACGGEDPPKQTVEQ